MFFALESKLIFFICFNFHVCKAVLGNYYNYSRPFKWFSTFYIGIYFCQLSQDPTIFKSSISRQEVILMEPSRIGTSFFWGTTLIFVEKPWWNYWMSHADHRQQASCHHISIHHQLCICIRKFQRGESKRFYSKVSHFRY